MKYECTSCGAPVARQKSTCGPCLNRSLAAAEATTADDPMMPLVARAVAGVAVGYGLVAAFLILTH